MLQILGNLKQAGMQNLEPGRWLGWILPEVDLHTGQRPWPHHSPLAAPGLNLGLQIAPGRSMGVRRTDQG